MIDLVIKNFRQIFLAIIVISSLFLLAKYSQKIKKFLSEVVVELGKVSWSTKDELVTATWVVIFSTALLAVFIFVVDSALSKLLSLMIK